MVATRTDSPAREGSEPRDTEHTEHAEAARHALSAGEADLAELGRELRAAGLCERAVRACFSLRSVVHVARRVEKISTPRPLPPAAVLPWLLAAGRAVPEATAQRALGSSFDRLTELGLLESAAGHVSPRLRLLPIAESIVVCPSTPPGHGGNLDDSSAHLLGALPQRRVGRWLDIGTGNAFAPLAARGLAQSIRATDIDDGALACARLGIALSGAHGIELAHQDLFDGLGAEPWDRITFNAPIPGPDSEILVRFTSDAPGLITKDGEILIHARAATEDPWRSLPGEVTIARYTPDSIQPPFAVLRWRPWAPKARLERTRTLSPDTPHIIRSWLHDVG